MAIKPTFEIVLFQPEIPPNTGNIIRLCANTGSRLHLIKPLGFDLSAKSLRRAGLDYKKNVEILTYNNLNSFFEEHSKKNIYMFTKFGNTSYEKVNYKHGDFLFFGSESKGYTDEVFKIMKNRIKIFIPMLPNSRSINLANAVSICLFEAWRQNSFNYFNIIK